jgi:hypothetical protein
MVYARTAFFHGDLTDAQKQEFYAHMQSEVFPILQTFQGVETIQINYPELIEPAGPQKLVLMMQHTYKDQATMDAALTSDRRVLSMHAANKIIEKLNISVYHINYQRESLEPK